MDQYSVYKTSVVEIRSHTVVYKIILSMFRLFLSCVQSSYWRIYGKSNYYFFILSGEFG